jgi:hypothetical protein
MFAFEQVNFIALELAKLLFFTLILCDCVFGNEFDLRLVTVIQKEKSIYVPSILGLSNSWSERNHV